MAFSFLAESGSITIFLSQFLSFWSNAAFQDKKDPKASFAEKDGGSSVEIQKEISASSKPLKERTSKAERRALQEAQRAAKAAAKGDS